MKQRQLTIRRYTIFDIKISSEFSCSNCVHSCTGKFNLLIFSWSRTCINSHSTKIWNKDKKTLQKQKQQNKTKQWDSAVSSFASASEELTSSVYNILYALFGTKVKQHIHCIMQNLKRINKLYQQINNNKLYWMQFQQCKNIENFYFHPMWKNISAI